MRSRVRSLAGWEVREDFNERMAFVRVMLFKTIENGWKAGLGPSNKPYWMCLEDEFGVWRTGLRCAVLNAARSQVPPGGGV
jgi:hypothetical protein